MSVPPEREAPAWEVRGDRPSERAPAHKPDRVGPLMVGGLLVAVIVALVLVVLLQEALLARLQAEIGAPDARLWIDAGPASSFLLRRSTLPLVISPVPARQFA